MAIYSGLYMNRIVPSLIVTDEDKGVSPNPVARGAEVTSWVNVVNEQQVGVSEMVTVRLNIGGVYYEDFPNITIPPRYMFKFSKSWVADYAPGTYGVQWFVFAFRGTQWVQVTMVQLEHIVGEPGGNGDGGGNGGNGNGNDGGEEPETFDEMMKKYLPYIIGGVVVVVAGYAAIKVIGAKTRG